MAQNIFRLVLTDEAQDFIESLPEAVSYKIYYNIKRVVGGERNKEVGKFGNMGVPYIIQQNCLSLVCLLG